MSVDFFPCDYCGESICDCGRYTRCNSDCYRRWCDNTCAEKDGYTYDRDTEEASCKFCREEDAEDSVLLQCLLDYYGHDRQWAIDLYNNSDMIENNDYGPYIDNSHGR